MKTTSQYHHKSERSNKRLSQVFFLLFGFFNVLSAADYPFVLPDTIIATLDVKSSVQEDFRNPLLGYNIFGFESAEEEALINIFNPTTLRFPHGLYANWYDHNDDQTKTFGTDSFLYVHRGTENKMAYIGELNAINTFDRMNKLTGINGLSQLNTAKKTSNKGLGYNVVWTFNMSADGTDFNNGSPESVAHYESLIARGFEVKDIEMGNECFYPGQRSSIIPNATEYIARAKSMYAALKAKDSTIQLSIPLLRRGSWVNPDWNANLTKDMSYFDAITVHTYIGADPDNAANNDEAYSTALTARKSLASSTNDFVRIYSGDKPIWLTEWGVKSGGPNAASVLGMADCYLFMAENQNIYQRANWFSVNGKLNSFLVWGKNSSGKSVIAYPLQKTGYGSTHEILKAVFENSTMLESSMSTIELVAGVKAVNARAVTKDGITTVFALNMTDKPSVFNLNIDGSVSMQKFLHETMAYTDVAQERVLDIDVNPLSIVKDGQGEIVLPPLSINKITLKGEPVPVEYAVNFDTPSKGDQMAEGSDLFVEASVGNAVTDVSLFINGHLVSKIVGEPYKWGGDINSNSLLVSLETGEYQLKLRAKNSDGGSVSDSINIEVKDTSVQYSYAGVISIPSQFEAEHYDNGGEGEAYHDSDDTNQTAELRADGVDIGTGGSGLVVGYTAASEWLEYTLNVEEDGDYDISIYYASGRPDGGAKVGLSFPDEDVVLLESYDLPVTGGWGVYEVITLIETQALTKGKHILRLTVKDRGFNTDWIEIRGSNVSGISSSVSPQVINVYPNPSSDGRFTLSASQYWNVYSIEGKRILEGKGTDVDMSAHSKGVYLLQTEQSIIKLLKD